MDFTANGVQLLDAATAVDHLVDLGLLSVGRIVSKGITVHDRSSRCRTFLVRTSGSGFVLKQGTNSETVVSVSNEAEIYQALAMQNPDVSIPRMYSFTGGHLVTECVAGASLHERIVADGTARAERAEDVASILARIHRLDVDFDLIRPARPSPAFLLADPPLLALSYHSNGTHQLTRHIQSDAHLVTGLRKLHNRWRGSHLIHNDVRPENLIERPDNDLVVIDWELAGMGDPRWDISALIADHLINFLEDAETWTLPEDRRAAVSASKLADLHHICRVILERYRAEGGPATHPTDLVEWVAGRLVLTTMERCTMTSSVTASCRHLLQVAANLFQRPEAGAQIFLGVAPS